MLCGPILGARLSWVSHHNLHLLAIVIRRKGLDRSSSRNRKHILCPLMVPFVERDEVPDTFYNCEFGLYNLIFPGGLEWWRADQSFRCMINWELPRGSRF